MARRLLLSLRERILGAVILALLAASAFFTVQVERHRRALQQTAEGEFATGQVVSVVAAIDGDEISVADGQGNRTVVRLLGVKAFEASRNDTVTRVYGQRAFEYLQTLVGRRAMITLGDPARDPSKRLLAYLELEGSEVPAQDVGLHMLEDGLAVAYIQFPHEREEPYLAAETRATRDRRGIWADQRAVQRVDALKALWQERRSPAP
ncbi:MAG: thermonuclease family protein [bacterium]